MPSRLLVGLILFAAGVARGTVVRLEMGIVPAAHSGAHLPETYELLRGRIYGESNPGDRRNAIIQDIELAPRNARERVEYVATFTLHRPAAGTQRSGVLVYELVYEVVNRGASFRSFQACLHLKGLQI